MDDWERFNSQFEETEFERNERLRAKRFAEERGYRMTTDTEREALLVERVMAFKPSQFTGTPSQRRQACARAVIAAVREAIIAAVLEAQRPLPEPPAGDTP